MFFSLNWSEILLLVGVVLQVLTMIMNKSNKVVPLAFLIFAGGNAISAYDNHIKKNEHKLIFDLVILGLNLVIAYCGSR
jgi:hypothetical protein